MGLVLVVVDMRVELSLKFWPTAFKKKWRAEWLHGRNPAQRFSDTSEYQTRPHLNFLAHQCMVRFLYSLWIDWQTYQHKTLSHDEATPIAPSS